MRGVPEKKIQAWRGKSAWQTRKSPCVGSKYPSVGPLVGTSKGRSAVEHTERAVHDTCVATYIGYRNLI